MTLLLILLRKHLLLAQPQICTWCQSERQQSHGLRRPSLLLGSSQGDELDLLPTQLDLKLIAGL